MKIIFLLLLQVLLVAAADHILIKRVPGRNKKARAKSKGNNGPPGNPAGGNPASTALVPYRPLESNDPSWQLRGAHRPPHFDRSSSGTPQGAQGLPPANAAQAAPAGGGAPQHSASGHAGQGPSSSGRTLGAASSSGAHQLPAPDTGGQGSSSSGRAQSSRPKRPLKAAIQVGNKVLMTKNDKQTLKEVQRHFGGQTFRDGIIVHENPLNPAPGNLPRQKRLTSMDEALATAQEYRKPATEGGTRHPIQVMAKNGNQMVHVEFDNTTPSNSGSDSE